METTPDKTYVNALLNRDHGAGLLYQMLFIRRFEDKAAEMYTKMKIRGFLHLCIGEEAIPVGTMQAIRPEDNVLCTYREHGHAIARGVAPEKIMAEMYGKQEGCSRGRGGSMHLFDKGRKFFGGNAIVGSHLPVSVGMALADKKMKKEQITCCFFGEGAAAEGEFHESMNLAALLQVPVLFICENNLYAMGTALRYSHAMVAIEKKGEAYGIQSAAVDAMDVLKVEQATKEAAEYVRSTGKPYLLVCNTYRFCAHSMFDTQLYRKKSEVEEWKKRDPVKLLSELMKSKSLISDEEIETMEEKIDREIQRCVAYAESGTWEPVGDLTLFVYSEP